jgi:hypothetical protein
MSGPETPARKGREGTTYWAERAAPDPAVLADLGPSDKEPGCICIIRSAPELDGEFGPGSKAETIDVNPGCLVHAGQRYSVVRCGICGVVARSHRGRDHPWTPDPEEKAAVDAKLGLPPDGHSGAAFDD